MRDAFPLLCHYHATTSLTHSRSQCVVTSAMLLAGTRNHQNTKQLKGTRPPRLPRCLHAWSPVTATPAHSTPLSAWDLQGQFSTLRDWCVCVVGRQAREVTVLSCPSPPLDHSFASAPCLHTSLHAMNLLDNHSTNSHSYLVVVGATGRRWVGLTEDMAAGRAPRLPAQPERSHPLLPPYTHLFNRDSLRRLRLSWPVAVPIKGPSAP